MQLRIYFSIVPQSCYSSGEQEVEVIYSDACNANGGGGCDGGHILHFLQKEIRIGWGKSETGSWDQRSLSACRQQELFHQWEVHH